MSVHILLGGAIQLQHLLQFLLSSKGSLVDADATLFSLLMVMNCAPASPTAPAPSPASAPAPAAAANADNEAAQAPAAPSAEDFDMTCVCTQIDFHDFLELFCRVVCSHLWAYTAPPQHSQSGSVLHGGEASVSVDSAKQGEGGDEDASVFSVSIADILSERLGLFKQTFAIDLLLQPASASSAEQ